MTKDAGERRGVAVARCGWCRRVIVAASGRGRPRKFCSQRCRQWDWVSRQRAADLALGADEIVVSRAALDALHDDLFVLAAALEDTERDLADPAVVHDRRELRSSLDWLVECAAPLRDRTLKTTPEPLEPDSG